MSKANQNKNQPKKTKPTTEEQQKTQEQELLEQFEALQQRLNQAQEKEKRSLADYQNLLRRTQEQRARLIKMANQELLTALLPIFENLNKACCQIDDEGLAMVKQQLWQKLQEFGLKVIDPLDQEFDLETMEVVEKQGEGETVKEVIQRGYQLNDQVIQHAKVVIG